ncbi:hypothetical protein CCMSSC00406_0007988 [Pleurotus cornucopiae]|uniref:Uncharacterized protein n=1 Tax=Pleurotus cornucopiae TaxID=5321 RepID=A0ACB7IKK2_PLECO|nr:hypothetical protein CCMSSC00406_0007988 [Pleurotus cornucopiae]
MWQKAWSTAIDAALLLSGAIVGTDIPECRLLPGDAAWPSIDAWSTLNSSIDGRLIKPIPIGAPCHHPNYDAEQCEIVRKNWRQPAFHELHPSSIMDPIFLNKTCDPFTDPSIPCSRGPYVEYTVNVTKPEHVIKTLKFVEEHNLRFVIKNTGHDYMGRSTGAGAVSVWMHHLKDITIIDNYDSPSSSYKGAAVKVSAGVTGEELVGAVDKRGLAIVSGECPTVGFAGGYIQGGGHSVLSSRYGMGADQALSYEVITPGGKFVTASPTENEDLYWALSGGGGGTYGILWSVTIKAYPDVPVTIASLAFATQGISQDTFWKAIAAYQRNTPRLTDAKVFSFAVYSLAGFSLDPVFAPGLTVDEVNALLKPFIDDLNELGIQYMHSVSNHPGYLAAFSSVPAFQGAEIANFQIGNRLLPRRLWEDESSFEDLMNTLKSIANQGGALLDIAVRPTLEVAGYPDNAILPAWRNAERTMGVITMLDDHQSLESIFNDQQKVTHEFAEALRRLAPEAGSYLNEASPIEPNVKHAFYGANYDRLLQIKDKYDPHQLLYGSISVGGDRWEETDEGRLCRRGTSGGMITQFRRYLESMKGEL